jgi:hypothetical protein
MLIQVLITKGGDLVESSLPASGSGRVYSEFKDKALVTASSLHTHAHSSSRSFINPLRYHHGAAFSQLV